MLGPDEKIQALEEEFCAHIFSMQTAFAVQSFVDSMNSDPAFTSIVGKP